MSAEDLLNRLQRVRRTGPGRWVARCPAHKDRGPSLSVRELDTGVTLVHCFAGCSVDSVLAAAGVDVEALFPPRPQPGGGRVPEARPFAVRHLLEAFDRELRVAYVLLSDVASGRPLIAADRWRAAKARDRMAALAEELRHVR